MKKEKIVQYASAIVTCGTGGTPCTMTDLFKTVQNFLGMTVGPLIISLAVLSISIAGVRYMSYGFGNASDKEKAKEILMQVAVGLLLVFAGYLIIKTVLGFFAADNYMPLK